MMAILIFANGDWPEQDDQWLTPYWAQAAAVIAADGGAKHLLRLGRLPQLVIGDLDSLTAAQVEQLKEGGAQFQQYPPDKDETDLELALLYAAQQDRWRDHSIYILGAVGGRLDQTLGNVLLLAHPALVSRDIRLIEPYQQIWLITDHTTVQGAVGDKLSFIPLGGDVHIATTAGLKWPLHREILHFGPARGISNELVAPTVQVQITQGYLLCIHTSRQWRR